MKRILSLALAAVGLALLSSGAALSASLTLGTCGTGGGWYQAGTILANIVNKYADGVNVNAVPTECAAYNLVALGQRRLDFAFTTSNLARTAYKGEDKFAGTGTEKKIRALFSYSVSYLHIFTLDPTIHTIADLKGKRVAVGSPASSSYQQATAVMRAAGLDPEKDVELVKVSLAAGTQQLMAGQIDAEFWSMALDVPSMLELVHSRTVYFVPITPEIYSKIPEELGVDFVKIPPETYENVVDAVPTLGIYSILVTTSDLADDTASKIVSTFFGHIDEFKAALPPSAAITTKEAALNGLPVPLHEGARAYYEKEGFGGLEAFETKLEKSGVGK